MKKQTGNREVDVLNFWNERASMRDLAGTNDLLAKELEMNEIANHIKIGQSVLDVGCGNGLTAFYLARHRSAKVTALDYSPEMIAQAQIEQQRLGIEESIINFRTQDVRHIASIVERYDVVITERVLINLASWHEQKCAIRDLVGLLNPGGVYLMCENLKEGLDNLNALRIKLDLPVIHMPWHNRYLSRKELDEVDFARKLAELDFTSAYYFLSRVVNAWLAKQEGLEPQYNAPVNRLALEISHLREFAALDLGQTRLWIWGNLT
jgi:SAM-dependent methyltransferase